MLTTRTEIQQLANRLADARSGPPTQLDEEMGFDSAALQDWMIEDALDTILTLLKEGRLPPEALDAAGSVTLPSHVFGSIVSTHAHLYLHMGYQLGREQRS